MHWLVKSFFKGILNFLIGSCTHGSVRLRGTTSHLIGEVEVCIRGVWSTVCGEKWDDNDATVVCRQLGLSSYGMSDFAVSMFLYMMDHTLQVQWQQLVHLWSVNIL